MIPRLSRVRWRRTYRLIRTVYPPVDLFEDIADPADWQLLAEAEAKTNPRVRDEIGAIHLVPPARRVSGPGAGWVMAPFCHVSRDRPSRFSDGGYGVYYAGNRFEVALAETVYHFGRFMAATDEEPATADYRELVGRIDAELHDLRSAQPPGSPSQCRAGPRRLHRRTGVGRGTARKPCKQRHCLPERPLPSWSSRGRVLARCGRYSSPGPASVLPLGRPTGGCLARLRRRELAALGLISRLSGPRTKSGMTGEEAALLRRCPAHWRV